MMDFNDFDKRIGEIIDQSEDVLSRKDWRAQAGQSLLFLAMMIVMLIVFPLIGAGVYIAGERK